MIQMEKPQQDTVSPLFRFVRQLAYQIPKARDGLEAWLERMAQAHSDLRIRGEEAQETGERYYVSVVLGADAMPLPATAERPERRAASHRSGCGRGTTSGP